FSTFSVPRTKTCSCISVRPSPVTSTGPRTVSTAGIGSPLCRLRGAYRPVGFMASYDVRHIGVNARPYGRCPRDGDGGSPAGGSRTGAGERGGAEDTGRGAPAVRRTRVRPDVGAGHRGGRRGHQGRPLPLLRLQG